MKVTRCEIPGVLLLEPRVFPDPRGWFFESFNERTLRDLAGVDTHFVQDNVSRSTRGVLRGLHFQNPSPQVKLVSCLEGEIWDVVVDIRKGSPAFGTWKAFPLSAENHHQLYVPVGMAHGFAVTSETAIVTYKVSDFWAQGTEGGVAWDDPDLGIPWPVTNPEISPKDQKHPRLRDLPENKLFRFEG
ncbi:MAG: dTDP-4-dehydrorhamnose 3,5-epimerase [Polyangiales bacterium]